MRPHLQLVERSRPRALSGAEIAALTAEAVAAYRARKEAEAADVEAWLGPADVPGYPAAHAGCGDRRSGEGRSNAAASLAPGAHALGLENPSGGAHHSRLRAFASTYWYEIGAAVLAFAAVLMALAGLGGRR